MFGAFWCLISLFHRSIHANMHSTAGHLAAGIEDQSQKSVCDLDEPTAQHAVAFRGVRELRKV